MKNDDMVYEVLVSMKHIINKCGHLLARIEKNEPLSEQGIKTMEEARFSMSYANCVMGILKCMMSEDECEEKIGDFDVRQVFMSICSCFAEGVSRYAPFYLSYNDSDITEESTETTYIGVNKLNFELLLYNLLYCCTRPLLDGREKCIKAVLDIKADNDINILSIKTNAHVFDIDEEGIINSGRLISESEAIDNSHRLSLSIVMAVSRHMGVKMEYRSMKGGSCILLYMPMRERESNSLKAVRDFVTDRKYIMELFSGLCEQDAEQPCVEE